MASIYKTLLGDDVANSRTLLHEAIPITGSIVAGTYSEPGLANSSVKQYAHGMFNSVYDYPYLSSSANHIFDISVGVNSLYDKTAFGIATGDYANIANQKNKKTNIYNQMAQVLMGHDVTGSVLAFDEDGDITGGGTKYNDVVFLNLSRLLTKDEIKKGTVEIDLLTDAAHAVPNAAGSTSLTIKDEGAASDYRVNSPAGEYGILKVTALTDNGGASTTAAAYIAGTAPNYEVKCGLVFYQAGVVVLSMDVFREHDPATPAQYSGKVHDSETAEPSLSAAGTIDTVLTTEDIDTMCTGIRNRIGKICFNNTTELNSTIYFCRANHNDFNYSSNPTYLKAGSSKIHVKSKTTDAPVSYITTIGLYSADNELLAVAKLSEPLRKDPTNDISLRVRLDY